MRPTRTAPHGRRRRRGDVGIVGTGERGRDALDVEAVLYPEWHAIERQSPRAGALLDVFGSGKQLIARHDGKPGAVIAPSRDGVGDSCRRLGG